jgi:Flp pilus assembly protein TadD
VGFNFATPIEHLKTLIRQTNLPAFSSSGSSGDDIEPLRAQAATCADPLECVRLRRQIVTHAAASSEDYSALGMALHETGAFGQAKQALIQAIAMKPDLAIAYLNLGMVYAYGLGNPESARQAFRKYLELQPSGGQAEQARVLLEKLR